MTLLRTRGMRQKSASGRDQMSTFSTCDDAYLSLLYNGAGIDSTPVFRASALKQTPDLPGAGALVGLCNWLVYASSPAATLPSYR